MVKVVESVSTAIGKVFDFFKIRTEKKEEAFLLKSAKDAGRAVDAAEKYILRNMSLGEKNDSKLAKYRKRFFEYN